MQQNLDKPWLGASWKIAGFACYAGLNAIAKYLSGASEHPLSVYQVVFFQDMFALLILLPWMFKQKTLTLVPNHFPLHLFRVITSAVAIISWYFALIYIPLAQAVALSIVGPMIGVIGAKLLLKEKFGWIRTLIIVVSLIGACFLVHPESALMANTSNVKGLLYIGMAAFFFAMAKIATRKLAQLGETAQSLTSYLFLFIVPVSLIPALFNWVPVEWAQLPWLMLAGAFTALAIYCVSSALVYAQVSFLAPFDICQFILNAIVGYVVFMELPAPWAIWVVLAFIGFTWNAKRKTL